MQPMRLATAPIAPGCGIGRAWPVRGLAGRAITKGGPLRKILIANRGEIACRVMRTAQRLGVKTVAVHSTVDADALHVRMADEAVCVGPPASAESYLCIDKIIAAMKQTGADSVHPGYGFLSENASFVQECEKNKIVFIGPSSDAMEAMGDKINSKKIAKDAKVNVIPGFLGEVEDPNDVVRISREIGYPVMLKASAGGGGKGMRIAWNDEEAKEGFRMSKQEAKSSFGDDRMLIEKFIAGGRHIEIQIMADSHGNVVYFPERECSIQRRNQKVIEESPSTHLDEATRVRMGEQAAALARAVNYASAGTVEFIVDQDRNFYFLEMNTRLQVEHPVTEYITGVDLVEMMIRVAQGEPLPITQKDIQRKGWAMEARVYAEDPLRKFMPSIGRLRRYVPPAGSGVRVDHGVYEGAQIERYYDPLISKLVTYGEDREQAVARMRHALDSYVIHGLHPNVSLLSGALTCSRSVLDKPNFLSGKLTTSFIGDEYKGGFTGYEFTPQQVDDIVAGAAVIHMSRTLRDGSLQGKPAGYQLCSCNPLCLDVLNKQYAVEVRALEKPGMWSVVVQEGDMPERIHTIFSSWKVEAPVAALLVDGRDVTLQYAAPTTEGFQLQYCGSQVSIKVKTPLQAKLQKFLPEKKEISFAKMVKSPMPGNIVSLGVKKGDMIVVGQELLVIEAMKMQNVIHSEMDGTIKKVMIKKGDDVAVDQILVEFE